LRRRANELEALADQFSLAVPDFERPGPGHDFPRVGQPVEPKQLLADPAFLNKNAAHGDIAARRIANSRRRDKGDVSQNHPRILVPGDGLVELGGDPAGGLPNDLVAKSELDADARRNARGRLNELGLRNLLDAAGRRTGFGCGRGAVRSCRVDTEFGDIDALYGLRVGHDRGSCDKKNRDDRTHDHSPRDRWKI